MFVEGSDGEASASPEPQYIVDRVSVEVLDVGPSPSISATVYGHYSNSCTTFQKDEGEIVQVLVDGVFYISIRMTQLEDTDCSLPGGEFQLGIGLIYDELTAGEYIVDVNGVRESFVLERDVVDNRDTVGEITALVRAEIERSYGIAAVDILSMQPVTWGDSCLEITLTDRDCLAVETPGYRISAGAGDQVWQVRTNADGSLLVVEPDEDVRLPVTVLGEYDAVYLRSGPGQDYPPVGQVAANDCLTAVGVSLDGEWLQVVLCESPYPYTLAWLLASLTDYAPEAGQLPVVAAELLPAADDTESDNLWVSLVADFISGLEQQGRPEESISLARSLDLLLVVRDDLHLGGDLYHNALYLLSLVDGLRLVYSPEDGTIFNYFLPPAGDRIILIIESPLGEDRFSLHGLSLETGQAEWVFDLQGEVLDTKLSPDGSELLFLRQTEGAGYELVRVTIDGGEQYVFDLSGSARSFAWSSDGTRVALGMANETGSTDLFTINANGRDISPVYVESGMDTLSGWSADGTQLLFSHVEDGNSEIMLLDLSNDEVSNISAYTFADYYPEWSPDERFVAYNSARFDTESSSSLMVWDSQSGQTVNISRGIVHQTVTLEDWAPDSRYVVASSEAGGESSLYIIDALTQQAYLLLGDYQVDPADISNLRWVERIQPASASQSIGEYWLAPVSPELVTPGEVNGNLVLVTILEDMNVRAGPGIDYALVGELDADARVEVVGKSWDGYWLKINYPRFGVDEVWVYAELTDFDPETPLPVLPGPVIDLSLGVTASD